MDSNLEFLLKRAQARHAHERGHERLRLPKESIDEIQRLADRMWYGYGRQKLFGTNYFSHLRDEHHNVIGHAAFQKVGNPGRNRLILTTILARGMHPRGQNIGSFFNGKVNGIVPKGPNDLKPFDGFSAIPDAKRISVDK